MQCTHTMLSINMGAEKRAWYQTYGHALDIGAFIPSSVTIRMMRNDVFAKVNFENTLFEYGWDNSSTTNRDWYCKPPLFKYWSDIPLGRLFNNMHGGGKESLISIVRACVKILHTFHVNCNLQDAHMFYQALFYFPTLIESLGMLLYAMTISGGWVG